MHARRSTQAATWFVMPFYQVYADAGDFSVKNKWVRGGGCGIP